MSGYPTVPGVTATGNTSTTGAVNAVVQRIATATDTVQLVQAFVTSRSATGDYALWFPLLLLTNTAGTVTVVDPGSALGSPPVSTGALGAMVLAAIVSGANVNLRVTGVAANTIAIASTTIVASTV